LPRPFVFQQPNPNLRPWLRFYLLSSHASFGQREHLLVQSGITPENPAIFRIGAQEINALIRGQKFRFSL